MVGASQMRQVTAKGDSMTNVTSVVRTLVNAAVDRKKPLALFVNGQGDVDFVSIRSNPLRWRPTP